MRIAFFSSKPYDEEYFETHNTAYGFEFVYFETALNPKTTHLTKGFDAICIFVNDVIDRNMMPHLSKNGILLITLRCAGFNNVDLEAAKANQISVARVPAYSPESIAEHTLALILTLNRKTHKAYNRVREGNFSLNKLMGFNLHGKQVGVIGTGKIGSTFCKVMTGLGCKIVAFDVNESQTLINQGIDYVSLNNLFETSDIISLHCPLTDKTKHIIDKDSLEVMKDGVMLINTSRGALINTQAAIHALMSKKIGYLGIDVYEQEEDLFFKDLSETVIEDEDILRLNSFPNVLITSHQAYFTKEAMEEITLTTLENIKAFEQRLPNPNSLS